ncbi:MAG TPA: 50S ribosomal protein L2 [Candidatus Nanoarchaeia archaeon]|nr:50S ribosomal protein L2P [uncultured archaeon]HZX12327.1 50S ribosomal protein L2 [Candidatus Nanoarchaeia archaeon]
MGKRIISQRRGRGTRRFISLPYSAGNTRHKSLHQQEVLFGTVTDIIHSPGHSAPLMSVLYEDGEHVLLQAPEKTAVGDIIATGPAAAIQEGNTAPLSAIPEGTSIYNIEQTSGDGGKYVRASGTFAKVLSKIGSHVVVQLPSKKIKTLNARCRATIGIIAGGGRLEKPFIKAGRKWHAKRSRGKLYPVTSAVAMNAVEHPFGSGRGRHMGKPSIAPRYAPPGRKVGQQHARRTGKLR